MGNLSEETVPLWQDTGCSLALIPGGRDHGRPASCKLRARR